MTRRYAIHICGDDDGRRMVPTPECPNAAEHTPRPPGYTQWHAWADQMAKTHRQRRCPGCNRLHIWEPKP